MQLFLRFQPSIRTPSIGLLFALASTLASCATSDADRREASLREDGLMLVSVRSFPLEAEAGPAFDMSPIEEEMLDCLRSEIEDLRPEQPLVDFDEFRALAFPDLPRDAAPRRPEFLFLALDDPGLQDRIAPLGLRYVVFVDGVTEMRSGGGGLCLLPPFCVGVSTWDRRSRLHASVVDLSIDASPFDLDTRDERVALLVIFGFLIFGGPALTETQACHDLAEEIAATLAEAS